mgnify:CR=1 FL=1
MITGLNRQLLTEATRHLDTVGERLYESTLLAFDKRTVPRTIELRARLMRLASELRDLMKD